MIRTFGNLSLPQIIEKDFPSIGDLKRKYDLQKTEAAIGILMFDLSAAFEGVLSKDDVEEICAEITSGILGNLTLEDLFLVCRKIKTSKQFGKLTINKVLAAVNKHWETRLETAERYSTSHNSALKVGSSHVGRLSPSIDEVEKQKSKVAFEIYQKTKK